MEIIQTIIISEYKLKKKKIIKLNIIYKRLPVAPVNLVLINSLLLVKLVSQDAH